MSMWFSDLECVNIDSILRCDGVSWQDYLCVPMKCNNFPKWCMFMRNSAMQETETLGNNLLMVWSVWCDLPFWIHEKDNTRILLTRGWINLLIMH